MKQIKPPIKCRTKSNIAPWVFRYFPKNYETLDYIETNIHSGSVYILKSPSNLEVINSNHTGILNLYKQLRDDPDQFIKKIKKTAVSERVFNRELNKTNETESEHAFSEYILRKFSKGEQKQVFAGKIASWNDSIKNLQLISKRLEKTVILNKGVMELVQAFNYENAFIFCDLIEAAEEMEEKPFTKLATHLSNSKSKVMVLGKATPLHKKMFKTWKCHKNKKINKDEKPEYLWLNY